MMQDVESIAKDFFAAYDAHDVEGMLGLFTEDAQGRYVPYGKESVVPIRGGLDGIWRAFPQAVPNFRVEVVEMLADENTVIVQAVMSGPIPADVPGVAKKDQVVHIPHAYFLRINPQGKVTRLDAYWDNTVLQAIKLSAV